MNKLSILVLTLIVCGFTFQNEDVKITNLGNCGFLYETRSAKVLIDPFGTEFGNFFHLPSSTTSFNIQEGNVPFNNTDLVLITHIHGDHFNPFLAGQFLQKNKNTKMICPPQVLNQLKDSCTYFKNIESQIISPQLSIYCTTTIPINDIAVTVVKMQHGTTRSLEDIDYKDYTEYEKTENFGYQIELNHKVIFHQGDGCVKINKEAISKLKQHVDIANLSYFDWDTVTYNILKEKLQAKHVIFMHGTKPGKELESETFKTIVPDLMIFNHEMEMKIFE